MTQQELKELRQLIKRYEFLDIDDVVSDCTGFTVNDSRENLEAWITNSDSLDFLVEHGAAKWLSSNHNSNPIPSLLSIETDVDYALKQLRFAKRNNDSTEIMADCTQRAMDALERIEAQINEAKGKKS